MKYMTQSMISTMLLALVNRYRFIVCLRCWFWRPSHSFGTSGISGMGSTRHAAPRTRHARQHLVSGCFQRHLLVLRREPVHGRRQAAVLQRHARNAQAHFAARQRGEQREVVAVTQMPDAEHAALDLAE